MNFNFFFVVWVGQCNCGDQRFTKGVETLLLFSTKYKWLILLVECYERARNYSEVFYESSIVRCYSNEALDVLPCLSMSATCSCIISLAFNEVENGCWKIGLASPVSIVCSVTLLPLPIHCQCWQILG